MRDMFHVKKKKNGEGQKRKKRKLSVVDEDDGKVKRTWFVVWTSWKFFGERRSRKNLRQSYHYCSAMLVGSQSMEPQGTCTCDIITIWASWSRRFISTLHLYKHIVQKTTPSAPTIIVSKIILQFIISGGVHHSWSHREDHKGRVHLKIWRNRLTFYYFVAHHS